MPYEFDFGEPLPAAVAAGYKEPPKPAKGMPRGDGRFEADPVRFRVCCLFLAGAWASRCLRMAKPHPHGAIVRSQRATPP